MQDYLKDELYEIALKRKPKVFEPFNILTSAAGKSIEKIEILRIFNSKLNDVKYHPLQFEVRTEKVYLALDRDLNIIET